MGTGDGADKILLEHELSTSPSNTTRPIVTRFNGIALSCPTAFRPM
jgi:hypothetical protein